MSVNSIQSWVNPNNALFLLINASTIQGDDITAKNIKALNISTGSLIVDDIDINGAIFVSSLYATGLLQANELSSITLATEIGAVSTLYTEHIILDQATLDVVGGNVLLLNGSPIATLNNLSSIADWSYYPAISSLQMANQNILNAGNIQSQNIFNALNIQTDTASILTSLTSPSATFTNTRTTNLSTTQTLTGNVAFFNSISTGSINGTSVAPASNWSAFPATQNVNMAGNNLVGGSNLAITTSNLTLTASNALVATCDDFTLTADEGANIGSVANVNITAQNGTYGAVNITANGGFSNAINGVVNITANGSQVGGVGQGGSINLTANTPSGFSNLTSKISLNASGINSYAGLVPPIASIAGYNFIYGTGGVNICAGLPAGALPNTAGTTYIYGTTGVEIPSQAYMYGIEPYWNGLTTPGDLNITGRYIIPNLAQVCLNLSNVRNLDFQSNVATRITNIDSIGMSNGVINGASQLNMSNGAITNVLTINGAPYPPPGGGGITSNQLLSTTAGLGTAGYVSSLTGISTIGLISTLSSGIYFNNANGRRNWIAETNYTTTQQNLGVFSDAYDVGGSVDTDWLKLRGVRLGYNGVSSFSKFERWGSNGFVLASQSAGNTTTADYIFASNASMDLMNVSSLKGSEMLISSFNLLQGGTKKQFGSNSQTRVIEYDYNPPLPQGSVEFAVSATPQTPSGVITGSLGVDLQAGRTYIQSVWDSYISMPMDFYGAEFLFNSDAEYLLYMNGNAGSPGYLSTGVSFYQASTITQKNQNIIANTRQPFIQYGEVATSGGTGNTSITLPIAYDSPRYVVHATMEDTSPSQISVSRTSSNTFDIYWANAGGGSHSIVWTTYGDL